ncbi:MAG TPA: hypothetical protein VGR03_14435 [Candidatus Acidoferrum sp.]|nr:hypothetical protein [Candidatus Acidoferrum sp.]
MTGQSIYSRNRKPIVGVAIVGFAFVTLLCKLDGSTAKGCNLLVKTAWMALEVLRPVIMLADWQAALASLCEDSGFLQHLLQIGESIWPLLCAMAG